MDIPYWSVIPNLTSDPQEREKVSVLPRIFASIGQSLIIAGFGVQIIKGLGGDYTGYHLSVSYTHLPSFEDYENEAQYNYISKYVQDTEDAIYGKDFKKDGKSYAEYMDVDARCV